MITGKRLLLNLGILLCACVLMCACAQDMGDALAMLDTLPLDAQESEEGVKYRIILSGDSSGEVVSAAENLAQRLEDKFGEHVFLTFDSLCPYRNDEVTEILVGNSDRYACAELMSRLNRDDYICAKSSDGSLVIGGRSDEVTVEAVERFVAECLPYATSEELLASGKSFEYKHEYEFDGALLCGIDLRDYAFVCDFSRESNAAKAVCSLREMIADACGAYPSIFYGSERIDGVKELFFSIYEGEGSFICAENEDVLLRAEDSYTLSAVMVRFYNELLGDADDVATFDVDGKTTVSELTPCIDVMHVTVNAPNTDTRISSATEIVEKIKLQRPDAVVFGETEADTWALIKHALPNGYEVVEMQSDKGVCATAYKTSVLAGAEVYGVENDPYAREIRFVHIATKHELSIFEIRKASEDILELVSKYYASGYPAVVLCDFTEQTDGGLSVGDSIAAVENVHVAVGGTEYRCAAFTSVGETESYGVQTSQSTYVRYSSFGVREVVCQAFKEL